MSIYATTLAFDDDGDSPAPLVYRGSHVWPDPTDRGGSFDLAVLPGFLTADGYDDGNEDGLRAWPWLRVALIGAAQDENRDTVLLDVEQARQLRDELTQWLNRTEETG